VQFNQTGATGDIFGHIEMAPVDPILGTTLAYRADPDPRKVDVGVGAYRTDES
jgi:aspartate/tyrosine/aromatic aminotransferase